MQWAAAVAAQLRVMQHQVFGYAAADQRMLASTIKRAPKWYALMTSTSTFSWCVFTKSSSCSMNSVGAPLPTILST